MYTVIFNAKQKNYRQESENIGVMTLLKSVFFFTGCIRFVQRGEESFDGRDVSSQRSDLEN
jgi:hypothetical protein